MIIGLVGRARVGKDTVANFLEPKYKIRRLAGPVKDAVKAIYGWTDEAVETDLKEVKCTHWGVTPRQTMIHLTQSVRAFMGSDFFTRRFFDSWDGAPIVIPDVRFAHDVEEIHRRGGITIKVTRTGVPIHEFEADVNDIETTYEVTNDGTIEELHEKINKIITGI